MNLRTDLRLPNDQYFPEKPKKDLIVLHHTVGGSAKSTFDYWRNDAEHIGTAYIVERDGTVHEVFPPECWAYHLGLKIGPMGVVDKRSIGIEIASEGPLLERDGRYYSFGRVSEQTLFSGPIFDVAAQPNVNADDSLAETEERAPSNRPGFGRLGANDTWRGYRYFAQYTPPAITAVCGLVGSLLTRFNIPRQTPSAHTTFDLNGLRNYSGVLTHCQLRADKSDCHPGFDWDKLVTDCNLKLTDKAAINAMTDQIAATPALPVEERGFSRALSAKQ